MSAVNSAVARAVDTGFRAAQARKATFGEAVSQTAGLENNKKSAETLMLLADIKGINTRLGDIIKGAWQLIQILMAQAWCLPSQADWEVKSARERHR